MVFATVANSFVPRMERSWFFFSLAILMPHVLRVCWGFFARGARNRGRWFSMARDWKGL